MGKVLMRAPAKLDVDAFAQEVAGFIHGKDFGDFYAVDVQMRSLDTIIVVMDDDSEFEITCRKRTT
jgi:hypothetical protein